MEPIKIILMVILFAILYGICHDLITAHISIEYFTIGHPIIIDTQSPITMALLWGVIATWWVGLILGCLLAIAARIGKAPKLKATQLAKSVRKLLFIMGGCAIIAGIIGYILTITGVFYLAPYLARHIAPDRHHLFLTAGWAHGASYLVGFLGGIILCINVWLRRQRLLHSRRKSKAPLEF